MSDAGTYLFTADNVWWRCAQYFVIASCGYMHSVCVDVCCIAAVVKDGGFLALAC